MAKKKNVLHIITNLELGGAQKNALYIIDHLDEHKYNKHFISAPRGLLQDQARQIKNVRFQFLPFLKRRISPINDLISTGMLIRYMRRNNIAIVHTHSSKAGILGRWAAKIAGVPVIIHTIHGWSFNKYMSRFTRAGYIFLERITSRITTKLIAVAENDIKKGIDKGIGDARRYLLVRCGIELDIVKSDSASMRIKESLGVDKASALIGMIACLKPQKNPLDFIRAAAIIMGKHPKARFILVGDGILRSRIERLIEKEKLTGKVLLLGWRRDIHQLIPIFDVIVLTSLWEGLPIALLEAMAQAKPIVAYDVGGIKEILSNGVNGYLVRAGDVNGLTEKINSLLREKNLSTDMGKKGRASLERGQFTAQHMIAQIETLYAEALGESLTPTPQTPNPT